LIEDRVSGLLCEPDARCVADAVVELARSPLLREHLAVGALRSARTRTWEQTLRRLAAGYERALGSRTAPRSDTQTLGTGAGSRAA
jgi:glycosyltransferase involved in cell wall biosynthesis